MGNRGTQSNGTNEFFNSMFAEPPEILAGAFLCFGNKENYLMLGNKFFSALFAIFFIILFTGCAVEGPPANAISNSAYTYGTLQSISVVPVNRTIASETHRQYIATGTYSNMRTADITDLVTWGSSHANIATVSNSMYSRGLATALTTSGATTISASLAGSTGTTLLTVTAATLTSLVITPDNPSIPDDTTQQFTATGTFNDGSTQDITASVTWTSSNQSAVTIGNTGGSKGRAIAVGTGFSTITATLGARTDSTTLTVTPPMLTSISITPATPLVLRGTTQPFTATGHYDNNTTQDLTHTVTWTSSDAGVATISSAGVATALSVGLTTITATSGLFSEATVLTIIASGTISLTWDAPLLFMDGSVLVPAADLREYRLYYRTAAQEYSLERMIPFTDHAALTITQPATLATGTYFFVVTAVTQDYLESTNSNEIERLIN